VEEECGPPLRSARLPHRWPNDLPTRLEARSFLLRLLCVSSPDCSVSTPQPLNLLSGDGFAEADALYSASKPSRYP
jgi:hypothetical protein